MSRLLKSLDISVKKIAKEAAQRDPELRSAWIQKLSEWNAAQLIFIDETGLNRACGYRTRGRATKGQRIRLAQPARMRENYSILPALSMDGYIACKAYKGGVNQKTFNAFIRDDVLPFCTPFPGPNSVIIMDNASIHRSKVRHTCDFY